MHKQFFFTNEVVVIVEVVFPDQGTHVDGGTKSQPRLVATFIHHFVVLIM